MRKIDSSERFSIAAGVAAAHDVACKLLSGQEPSPGEWQRVPDYACCALRKLRPERSRYQSSRLDEPPRLYSPPLWFNGLLTRLPPINEKVVVAVKNYDGCLAMSAGVYTDTSLEAATREFRVPIAGTSGFVFPTPVQLRKFLVAWGEEHRSSETRDRRQRSLALTDEERQLLSTAEAGVEVPHGPIRRLSELHVCIAKTLACREKCGHNPSHEQLARASGTSIRTVRRALPALRALGLLRLLPLGARGLPHPPKPRHVSGFPEVMAVIAKHTGRSVKTLYRWEQEFRAFERTLQDKAPRTEPPQKGKRARRMRGG